MNTDSVIMLRRNFKHTVRNPTAVFNAVILPVVLMLMFVYVLGRAFNVGVKYIDYSIPGMILLAICYGLSATALAVNSDMTKGIINRFKVMDISRSAVLNAQVAATMLRSLVAIAAILAVGFALGFRSSASFLDWLGAIGMILAVSFAASWLTVALGLFAKTPESAGMALVPLILLPFLSSAIVPVDKMGTGIRQFAEYQPFTPIIESIRGLLSGAPSGGYALAPSPGASGSPWSAICGRSPPSRKGHDHEGESLAQVLDVAASRSVSAARDLDQLRPARLGTLQRRLGEPCVAEAEPCCLLDPGRIRVGQIRQPAHHDAGGEQSRRLLELIKAQGQVRDPEDDMRDQRRVSRFRRRRAGLRAVGPGLAEVLGEVAEQVVPHRDDVRVVRLIAKQGRGDAKLLVGLLRVRQAQRASCAFDRASSARASGQVTRSA